VGGLHPVALIDRSRQAPRARGGSASCSRSRSEPYPTIAWATSSARYTSARSFTSADASEFELRVYSRHVHVEVDHDLVGDILRLTVGVDHP